MYFRSQPVMLRDVEDGSFEHPKRMSKLKDKEIVTILPTIF